MDEVLVCENFLEMIFVMSKMDVNSFVLMNSANIYIQGEQAVACCEGANSPKGPDAQKVSVGTKRCLLLCLLYKCH